MPSTRESNLNALIPLTLLTLRHEVWPGQHALGWCSDFSQHGSNSDAATLAVTLMPLMRNANLIECCKSGSFHVHSMGFFGGIQTDSHEFQVLALCSTDQHCQHHSSQDSFWRGPGSFSFGVGFSQEAVKVCAAIQRLCASLRELQILSCAVVHFREVMIVMQICQCLITVRCQDLPLINFGELMTEQFMAWTTNSAIYSRNGHLAVVNCLAEFTKLSEAEPVSLWIYGPFTSFRNLSPL